MPHVVARYARWRPSVIVGVFLLVALVIHEIAYHLSAGDDYPVTLLLIEDQRVLPISHGGVDIIIPSLIAVALLLFWEAARLHEGER